MSMDQLTPKKVLKALDEMQRIGLIEPDGEYFRMTDAGREIYLMCKELERKLQKMENKDHVEGTG